MTDAPLPESAKTINTFDYHKVPDGVDELARGPNHAIWREHATASRLKMRFDVWSNDRTCHKAVPRMWPITASEARAAVARLEEDLPGHTAGLLSDVERLWP